ncbi:MAG: hypothetical protein ACREGR_01540 [Minisyncoccia bacterium]
MALTYFYAQLLGIMLTVIGLAFLINRRHVSGVVRQLLDTPALLFAVGIVTLIFGSIFVLTHNVWDGGFLSTLVTVLAWITFLRGALLMLLPQGTVRRIFSAVNFTQSYYAIAFVFLVVGLYLAWNGFSIYYY